MIDLQHITKTLEGYYPNSTLLTPLILSEMANKLRKLYWTNEIFNEALLIFRDDKSRGDIKEYRTPPTYRQLISYYDRAHPVARVPEYENRCLPRPLAMLGIMEAFYRLVRHDPKKREEALARCMVHREQCEQQGIPMKTWLDDLPENEKPPYLRKETE